MTDLEALYRAILREPDEDTPRLAYADEVEERGDPARAELIRLQVRDIPAAQKACDYCSMRDLHWADPERRDATAERVRCGAREYDLLRSSACRERWEPACVACGGTKEHTYQYPSRFRGETEPVKCHACLGTGRQQCRWERGFPVVEVHALRQAWERAAWRPTPWLCDLLSTHHVAGVLPLHLEPGEVVARQYVWAHGDVPDPVFKHCSGIYETPEKARTALGRAIVLAALEWLDAQPAPVPPGSTA